jgi:single stranded DNA-binding protein
MSFASIPGRLGRDAELRQGDEPSKSVLNFSVAEDIGYGESKRVQWWKCALWGKRAEALAPYLTKGTPVTVFGNPELREYQKKDGTQGAELNVRVTEIALQGRGQERDADQTAAPVTRAGLAKTPQQLAREANRAPVPDGSDFQPDSEIPFN